VDHEAFILEFWGQLNVSDEVREQLMINLYPGSIIVQITGATEYLELLRAMPLNEVTVWGSTAVVTMLRPELPTTATTTTTAEPSGLDDGQVTAIIIGAVIGAIMGPTMMCGGLYWAKKRAEARKNTVIIVDLAHRDLQAADSD